MSRRKGSRLRKFAPQAALATAILVGATLFAVATTARGASHRAQVAQLDITETCSARVEPGATVNVQAVVDNTGDEVLIVPVPPDADAGTPDDTADDFSLTYQSGDTNGDKQLDPTEQWTYTGSFTAPAEDVLNIVGVQPVKGKVFVKKAGSNTFVALTGETEIPVGSQVNTLNGTIMLTAGLGGGKTNAAEFYQGIFTILQAKARGAYMTLRLGGGNFRLCGRASTKALSIEAKSKRPIRRLWGSGKGRFTTRGRYSAATVRGTKWLTQDQCNGTLTRVVRGVVRVRNFRARKIVNVRAGHSYLALAPGA